MTLEDVIEQMRLAGCTKKQMGTVADGLIGKRSAKAERKDAQVYSERRYLRRIAAPLAHRTLGIAATPRLPEKEWLPLTGVVYRRDGRKCYYCNDEGGPFSVDHVVPLARGGTNELSNLVVACRPCNSSKCDLMMSEWKGRYVFHADAADITPEDWRGRL